MNPWKQIVAISKSLIGSMLEIEKEDIFSDLYSSDILNAYNVSFTVLGNRS